VVKGINSTVRLYSALMCANEDGGNETVKGLLGKYGWKLERVTGWVHQSSSSADDR